MMNFDELMQTMMGTRPPKVCVDYNLWELFAYQVATMNPALNICVHYPEKEKGFEIPAIYVIHHPDIAGKTLPEVKAYSDSFFQKTGTRIF